MPDVFISYSRHDSERALELSERLRGWGVDVWIDSQGIDAADLWPKEIVQAIWGCKAFVVLISESSLVSKSVFRELSVAIEKKKPVLPLKLSAVQLNEDFAYQLAGVQRISASDYDAIERSLTKLGILKKAPDDSDSTTRNSSGARSEKQPVSDNRTSLIVLPFEDLSPAAEDNVWFADGLAGELINALGHIKSLRILDRKTSLGLRAAKLRTVEIGKEFKTRYFIEGSVRKFGEEIKISVSLLDIETGEYLWQESHRGEFTDIFDIQESVAKRAVDGLKLHLTREEQSRVQDRGTENTEAYEFFVKAHEYFDRHTKEGFDLAIELISEAIRLDPDYAEAYAFKADALASLYRIYQSDRALLDEGMGLVHHALRLKPDLWEAYWPLSILYRLQGHLDEAENIAKEYIAKAPDRPSSHFALGFFYDATGRYVNAIAHYEYAVKLDPESLPKLWNLILACHHAGDEEKRSYWVRCALPLFERHLKFVPNDEFQRVCFASLLHFAGRNTDARNAAHQLGTIRDGTSLYSLACLQCELGDYSAGLVIFRKSIEAGYRNIPLLQRFLTDTKSGVASLAGTQEYEQAERIVNAASHL